MLLILIQYVFLTQRKAYLTSGAHPAVFPTVCTIKHILFTYFTARLSCFQFAPNCKLSTFSYCHFIYLKDTGSPCIDRFLSCQMHESDTNKKQCCYE